jgi:heavy metal sensor kinase
MILRSVRARLTLWYVLLLAVILAGFSGGVYLLLRHNLYDNLDQSAQSRADTLLGVVIYEEGRPTLPLTASPDPSSAEESFARVFDAAGEVTFDGSAAAGGAPIDRAAVDRALRGETSTRTATVGDEKLRVRVLPIEGEDGIAGVLEVGQSRDDVNDTLSALLIILAVAYPVTLAAASAGGVFLAGRALSPIDSLTRLARRITAEDLSERLAMELPDDEVGRLARTFDDMIARLDAAFRRQRQFTADASHELRTPLTAIKGQVEVALGKERDAADYREVLRSVNEEVDRLIRMVASLLTLARADAGQIPIATEPVSLGDLVVAAVEQLRPMAEQRGLELGVEAGPTVALQADEDLILQLVLNLLDNAIKYTAPGGSVTAAWSAGGGQAQLRVSDTGAGIPAEHLGRVFDRFYRVDSARSRDEGGAGLGLSICRWIAEAHGGSISAESEPGRGATFTVALPLSP